VTIFIKYRKFLISKNKLKVCLKNKERFREDFITSNFSIRAESLFGQATRTLYDQWWTIHAVSWRGDILFDETRHKWGKRERERESPDSRDFWVIAIHSLRYNAPPAHTRKNLVTGR